jgi:hypothetical protein
MRLALMPNPQQPHVDDFQRLGPMIDSLRPDQHIRLQQILSSWGLQKHGLPITVVRRAIRKVLQNWP